MSDLLSRLGGTAVAASNQPSIPQPQPRSVLPQTQTQAAQVGHFQWDRLAPEYDRSYLPVPTAEARKTGARIFGGHFLWVFGASLLLSFGSLLLGSFSGPLAVAGPTLAIMAVAVGLYHGLGTYALYSVAQPYNLMVHTNPIITLLELFHGTMGWRPALVQISGQIVGHAAAAAVAYGVLNGGVLYTDGISASLDETRTSVGGLLGIEIVAGFFFGWLLWHNYYHRLRDVAGGKAGDLGIFAQGKNLPAVLGALFGFTTAFAYPFGGVTMHQPLRMLQGCLLAIPLGGGGTCGNTGSWVYFSGGAIGLVAALLGHALTQGAGFKKLRYRYSIMLAKSTKTN